MHVNWNHARFNLAKELLCLIPPEPAFAIRSELMADLLLDNQAAITALLGKLPPSITIRHFNATDGRKPLGRALTIQADSWRRAKRIAENYWESVYGEVDA